MLSFVFSIILAAKLKRIFERYCEKFIPKLDVKASERYCGVTDIFSATDGALIKLTKPSSALS